MRIKTSGGDILIIGALRFVRPPALRIGSVRVQPFVAHLSSLFGPQARDKGIAFIVTNDCAGEWMLDKEQMTQAMLNVLQNALDATERGGPIVLTAAENGRVLAFTISDTGTGIGEEEKEKIFNLYFCNNSISRGRMWKENLLVPSSLRA